MSDVKTPQIDGLRTLAFTRCPDAYLYWGDATEKRQPAAFDKDRNSTTSVDTPLGFAEQGGDIVGNSWLGVNAGVILTL